MPNLLGKIPWIRKLFSRGANTDVRPDLFPNDGTYHDAYNMRTSSVDGNLGALESIGGEEVRWDESAATSAYECIGACSVTGYEVSFWAHGTPSTNPGQIYINGMLMVESLDIPYRVTHPLQFGDVSKCTGGVIYPADRLSDPLFWDIPRIVEAYNNNTQEFFSLFDLQSVSVKLASPAVAPVHIGNPEVGVGLPVGQYVYRLRYRTIQGDKSNYGLESPHISVEGAQAPTYAGSTKQYLGGQTAGRQPDPLTPTPYGIHLRWFVDNTMGFEAVEVCRRRYNDGQGLSGPGVDEIVGVIDLAQNQMGYIEFIDPVDSNIQEVIPSDEALQEHVQFTAPGAVDYVDNRVVYADIQLRDKQVDLTFQSSGGNYMFPITTRVHTYRDGQPYDDGFADAVNNTYKKSALHNETYKLGIMVTDGAASKSYVAEIGDITMPARRNRKSGDSLTYSTDPIYAANTECTPVAGQVWDPVSPTFDAIVQGNTAKPANDYVGVNNGLSYNPWTPRGSQDSDHTRYGTSPVTNVVVAGSGLGDSLGIQYMPDAGACFGQQYHSLGVGIYGPQNIDADAPGWAAMTVMRSEPAGRVIASGISSYALRDPAGNDINDPATYFSNGKYLDQLWAYFPDIDAGIVPQNVLNDIQANPQRYRLKFTPFGGYSETYGYHISPYFSANYIGGTGIDRITYATIQHDHGQVNVSDSAPQGYQPTLASTSDWNFVGYAHWRFPFTAASPLTNTADPNYSTFIENGGDFEMPLEQFVPHTEGRGRFYKCYTQQNVYKTSGLAATAFAQDDATRRFHEPFYVVDLIRTGAQVSTAGTMQWLNTGTHVYRESCLGVFDLNTTLPASNAQVCDVELFHARVHDAVGRTSSDFRYAYIREQGQPDKRWMCITNNAVAIAQFSTIIADIQNNGFWVSSDDGLPVYGIYQYYQDISSWWHPRQMLRFGSYTQIPAPATGARIIVKYDEREPIIAHGFDGTIAPVTFAPIDRTYNKINDTTVGPPNAPGFLTVNTSDNALRNWAPMPYGGQSISNYALPWNSAGISGGGQSTAGTGYYATYSVRQWVVMADLVTRVQTKLMTPDAAGREAFPRTHYVMRPYYHNNPTTVQAAGLNPQYEIDYGLSELQYFSMGGFRFWGMNAGDTTFNLDYAKQPIVTGLGVPVGGQDPTLDLCSSYIASERYNPLAQDAAGNLSFPYDNLYHVSQDSGRIMMIHALDQGGGQRLYGWCEKGVHHLPYNKRTITDADGNIIGTQSISNFWPEPGSENWIARGERGCPGPAWRFSWKANIVSAQGGGDTVAWADRSGVYRLVGGSIVDILRGKRMKELLPILKALPSTYRGRYASVVDYDHAEGWMQIQDNSVIQKVTSELHVFNPLHNEWTGTFGYEYDDYLFYDGKVIGYRDGKAINLDTGFVMEDGTPVECDATQIFFAGENVRGKGGVQFHQMKEAMRFNVVGSAPSYVEVYDSDFALMCRMDAATNGTNWVKEYDGWEGWVSRVLASVNAARPLPQSMGFYVKVGYLYEGDKTLVASDIQMKPLK